ncbi:MAG: 1,4-alpha-glucan branching protein GlgB [Pseudomonadota bacterium]
MTDSNVDLADTLNQVVNGTHGDPFSVLGCHGTDEKSTVTCFYPKASAVMLCDQRGKDVCQLTEIHPAGVFRATINKVPARYRLKVTWPDGNQSIETDPYQFGPALGDVDCHLLGEGAHLQIYNALGAHVMQHEDVGGTRFALWAPNASRVSVIGDFNQWDGRRHPMRLHPGIGVWEIFIPDIGKGARYKFELLDRHGQLLPLKSDPYGNAFEPPPHNAAIVEVSNYQWRDGDWQSKRQSSPAMDTPQSIYEVHLGSWRRGDGNRWLSYDELAEALVDYVVDMGFTHIELMPITEHPFDGSWGYQPIGMFAPTWRFGEPDGLKRLIDRCHQAGVGVIVDWVPAHFPRDAHGLAQFDGTALYEHEDPRKGAHADWGTLIFNYGRREVVNYLIGSALYWIREFHVDALRVDAVASMLYLDYSRNEGEWLPNEYGGNEHLEAVAFLKRLNELIHASGASTYAEESTAWPGVSKPTFAGGLGFTHKWNMGWMNDTLRYMSEDPIHRRYHHDKVTFGLVYAFDENFVLPLSHDEVVHGKGSLLGRMPGDEWQRFANLRAYLAMMFCHPGKKLLFMGGELAQSAEWNHDQSLDWHLLEHAPHAGIQQLVRDLNTLYRVTPALFERDYDASGFYWLDWEDADNSVYSWVRLDKDNRPLIVVVNMTPVVRESFQVGVPTADNYREIFNSDHERYGGSHVINPEILVSETISHNGQPASVTLTLPPLAAIVLANH